MFTADAGNPFKSLRYIITLISTIKCKLAYALCSGNALALQSSGPGSILSGDDKFFFFTTIYFTILYDVFFFFLLFL